MSIFSLSKTANSNTTIAGVTMAEGMSPAAVNNGIRAFAADIKKWQEDMGAAVTTGGSANTYTLTTNSILTALEDGQELGFVASATNTGASTLAVDGLSAKAIRRDGDSALLAGQILAGGHYTASYDASANSAAGAWMLRNPSQIIDITGTTELTAPAVADEVMVFDASAAANRKITLLNLLKVINELTAETAPAIDDLLALYDTSGTATDKITLQDVLKVVGALTALTEAPHATDDFLLLYDGSASLPKKIVSKWIGAGNRTEFFAPGVMVPPTTQGAAVYSIERGTTNDVMANGYSFSASASRRVQIAWSPPFTWDAGTLGIKLRWIPVAGGTGSVRWAGRAQCYGDGTAIDAAWGTQAEVTDAQIGDDGIHHSAVISVTASNATAGKFVMMEIVRLGADAADTLTTEAVLLGVEVTYLVTENTSE